MWSDRMQQCNLPSDSDGGSCTGRTSLEEASIGLGLYHDPLCGLLGGVGCGESESSCRVCATTSAQKNFYVACPSCALVSSSINARNQAIDDDVLPYSYEEACDFQTLLGSTCMGMALLGDIAAGLGKYYDASCLHLGGVGCEGNGCRVCATSDPQKADYVACPPCMTDHSMSSKSLLHQSQKDNSVSSSAEDFQLSPRFETFMMNYSSFQTRCVGLATALVGVVVLGVLAVQFIFCCSKSNNDGTRRVPLAKY
mmetsp:Transcript_18405/g.34625  ORF Transcript_18405/g.34625 Transcript_18405/m.34625 type:complete len:254 (-) Transcript_18405:69-830(-)